MHAGHDVLIRRPVPPVQLDAGSRPVLNLLHAAVTAPAERGTSLLEPSFTALPGVNRCPWRIGAVTAAALVLPNHVHDRTT